MKVKMLIGVLAIAAPSFAQLVPPKISEQFYYPPAFATPQKAPELQVDTPDPNYFKLPAGDLNWGEVSAVTTNSKGHVFVLNRGDVRGGTQGYAATQILEFDEKGAYVGEWGHNVFGFAYGHGVRADKNDNIWVVDKGTDMVTEFNKTTKKVMMVLGRRPEATSKWWVTAPEGGRGGGRASADRNGYRNGEEDGGFGEPTDIAWDSQGNIYISDGYVHARVAKFDKYGTWLGAWGKHNSTKNGEEPLPGEFATVHNVQIDKNDNVWVADRSNGRSQVFDTNGNFLRQVILNVPVGGPGHYTPLMGHQTPPMADNKQGGELRPGTPDALCIPPDNTGIIFFGDVYPGRVYKVNTTDGKVLGWFGHVGRKPGEMGAIHGLACPSENLIYTAEFVDDRVQKFVIHPNQTNASKTQTTASK